MQNKTLKRLDEHNSCGPYSLLNTIFWLDIHGFIVFVLITCIQSDEFLMLVLMLLVVFGMHLASNLER